MSAKLAPEGQPLSLRIDLFTALPIAASPFKLRRVSRPSGAGMTALTQRPDRYRIDNSGNK